jgi:hypothetical protein
MITAMDRRYESYGKSGFCNQFQVLKVILIFVPALDINHSTFLT